MDAVLYFGLIAGLAAYVVVSVRLRSWWMVAGLLAIGLGIVFALWANVDSTPPIVASFGWMVWGVTYVGFLSLCYLKGRWVASLISIGVLVIPGLIARPIALSCDGSGDFACFGPGLLFAAALLFSVVVAPVWVVISAAKRIKVAALFEERLVTWWVLSVSTAVAGLVGRPVPGLYPDLWLLSLAALVIGIAGIVAAFLTKRAVIRERARRAVANDLVSSYPAIDGDA